MRSAAVVVILVLAGVAYAEPTDLHDWMKARGASTRSLAAWQAGGCEPVTVGPSHEEALRCYEQESVTSKIPGSEEPAYRVLDHYSLRTVRAKKLVVLIDVPVKSEPLDGVPRPLNAKRPPWHPFELAADGQSIVVGDPAEADGCKAAPASKISNDGWDKLDHDLSERVCKARGRYLWRDGVFRRTS